VSTTSASTCPRTAWESEKFVDSFEKALTDVTRPPCKPDATASGGGDDVAFGGSVDELARSIDAYEALGFDDLIVGLEPMNERSLDRLAEALRLAAR
jgi:hypothetical protein